MSDKQAEAFENKLQTIESKLPKASSEEDINSIYEDMVSLRNYLRSLMGESTTNS